MSWHFRESVPTHVNNIGDTINQPQACHHHSQIYWDQNIYPTYRLTVYSAMIISGDQNLELDFKIFCMETLVIPMVTFRICHVIEWNLIYECSYFVLISFKWK